MSLLGPSRLPTSTVIKGSVDASLSANLPASPAIGDTWIVSVAGDFQNDALVSPANYDLTIGDMILWDGTNWLVRESGDDSMKTTLNLSDVADAPTARTNLSVPATDPTGVTGADQITNIMSLTQAEFDAIGTPNASTLYVITDATPTMTEAQTNSIAIKYAIALG